MFKQLQCTLPNFSRRSSNGSANDVTLGQVLENQGIVLSPDSPSNPHDWNSVVQGAILARLAAEQDIAEEYQPSRIIDVEDDSLEFEQPKTKGPNGADLIKTEQPRDYLKRQASVVVDVDSPAEDVKSPSSNLFRKLKSSSVVYFRRRTSSDPVPGEVCEEGEVVPEIEQSTSVDDEKELKIRRKVSAEDEKEDLKQATSSLFRSLADLGASYFRSRSSTVSSDDSKQTEGALHLDIDQSDSFNGSRLELLDDALVSPDLEPDLGGSVEASAERGGEERCGEGRCGEGRCGGGRRVRFREEVEVHQVEHIEYDSEDSDTDSEGSQDSKFSLVLTKLYLC